MDNQVTVNALNRADAPVPRPPEYVSDGASAGWARAPVSSSLSSGFHLLCIQLDADRPLIGRGAHDRE
ncbi:MAG: hypothetical protein LC121_20570 [Anaerolineae bacterium]|nr:hypothetical protein [Anaerolineae bacterium]